MTAWTWQVAAVWIPVQRPRTRLARPRAPTSFASFVNICLQRAEEAGSPLPAFVVDELEGLLRCGDFDYGFLQLHCNRCGHELRVPFSCKARGTCLSCIGRRMGGTASLWVEHLLPAIPYRQWVLSWGGALASRPGYDAELLGRVCQVFSRELSRFLRRRVKREAKLASTESLHPGIIIVVQRFRSDLGLYVHLHALVSDGVFDDVGDSEPVFRRLATLEDGDLLEVLRRCDSALGSSLDDDFEVDQ